MLPLLMPDYYIIWEDYYQDNRRSSLIHYELIVQSKHSSIHQYKMLIDRDYDANCFAEFYYQTVGNGFKLFHKFRVHIPGDRPSMLIYRHHCTEVLKTYLLTKEC